MHLKEIPADVVKFAGKHKLMLIGGVALAGGAFIIMSNNAKAANAQDQSGPSFPYTSSFSPLSSGMVGGPTSSGGGGLVPTADAGGSLTPTQQSNSSVYNGAFGSYKISSENAAAYDLSRQNMEYGYNAQIYGTTLAADNTLAALNLDAYNSTLAYGANAGNSNNSFLTAALAAGYAPDQLSSVLGSIYRKNPVTPQASFNAPSYYDVPGTFGTGVTQNTGVQNVNRPAAPSYATSSTGVTDPADQTKRDWTGYVNNNADLSAAYYGNPATVAWWADKGGAAAWGAYSYAGDPNAGYVGGAAQGRTVPLIYV